MEQQDFFKSNRRKSYGGETIGVRKKARPLDNKKLHHIVMRSQFAVGRHSFKSAHHQMRLKKLIFDKAKLYYVSIAEFSNVGNHFHLLVKFQKRHLVQNFFRVVLGLIARIVVGAQKGKKFGKFWDGLVFTRVVSKGRDEARIFDYLTANNIQAEVGDKARHDFERRQKMLWKLWFTRVGQVSRPQRRNVDCQDQMNFSV